MPITETETREPNKMIERETKNQFPRKNDKTS
uniref:Uncharacterized protein n=1 Tax=Rhizophora mucronata TaxID=61149 RepID=A0A2P2JXU7_RHIMU